MSRNVFIRPFAIMLTVAALGLAACSSNTPANSDYASATSVSAHS